MNTYQDWRASLESAYSLMVHYCKNTLWLQSSTTTRLCLPMSQSSFFCSFFNQSQESSAVKFAELFRDWLSMSKRLRNGWLVDVIYQQCYVLVCHNFIAPSKELYSKMALGVTPMMMAHPCPSSSRFLRTFFKSHNFFIMEKWPVSEQLQVKVETLNFQQFYLMKFQVSTLT